MLTLLAAFAAAHPFTEPGRWVVRSEVDLPAVMWVGAERNTEARLLQWDLEFVLACAPAEGGRAVEVLCAVEDAAIAGGALPADAGKLAGILEEIDRDLSGATIELRVGPHGHLRGVGMRGLDVTARRSTAMNENLRLMVSRAVAGFDLPVGDGVGDAWSQRAGWITQLPAAAGTVAGGRVVHERREDGMIGTTGRVLLEPHGKYDAPPTVCQGGVCPAMAELAQLDAVVALQGWFETELRAVARLEEGALVERTWEAVAHPTPSSRMATGSAGYPYRQSGSLRRLGADEAVQLGETREIAVVGPTPTAIQVWETLGVVW